MPEISEETGVLSVLSHLRVLINRLRSRPDTIALSEPLAVVRESLRGKQSHWQELHDLRVSASGAVVFADDEEDDTVADLARRLSVLVSGKRGDPRYRLLFERAPSDMTEGVADEEQARLVNHLIATIGSNEDYVSLRDLLPALSAARAAVVSAKAAQQSALQVEEGAWNAVQVAETAARDLYRDTKPALELLFPGRKRLVASFYPSTKR